MDPCLTKYREGPQGPSRYFTPGSTDASRAVEQRPGPQASAAPARGKMHTVLL